MKLRKKIGTTVQILSHIKEKLSFVSDQREQASKFLNEKEHEVKQVYLQLICLPMQIFFPPKVHLILSIFEYVSALETGQNSN